MTQHPGPSGYSFEDKNYQHPRAQLLYLSIFKIGIFGRVFNVGLLLRELCLTNITHMYNAIVEEEAELEAALCFAANWVV